MARHFWVKKSIKWETAHRWYKMLLPVAHDTEPAHAVYVIERYSQGSWNDYEVCCSLGVRANETTARFTLYADAYGCVRTYESALEQSRHYERHFELNVMCFYTQELWYRPPRKDTLKRKEYHGCLRRLFMPHINNLIPKLQIVVDDEVDLQVARDWLLENYMEQEAAFVGMLLRDKKKR